MRKAYALVVFLLVVNYGKAATHETEMGYGIVATPGGNGNGATGRTVTVARLRHKLVEKAVAAYLRAMKFANAGAWQLGALELQKAVAIDPGFSDAHGSLGAHYLRMGRPEDGANEIRSAIGLDPANSIHHANLAVAMCILGRWNDAEPDARVAVALDGTNFTAHYLLGILLARKAEDRDAAIPHLKYAARDIPDAHLDLAELYQATGKARLAQVELDRYRSDERKMSTAQRKHRER